MLEGEYLEMVNDLRDRFEEKDKEMEKIKEQNSRLKKDLISAFGFVRILDYFSCEVHDVDYEIKSLIDVLRSYLSSTYDEIISV